VTFVAFEMGSNLDLAIDSIKSTQKWVTVGAAAVVISMGIAAWLFLRKRKTNEPPSGD
jgi:membrane protein DedA with SNARE-associated domain